MKDFLKNKNKDVPSNKSKLIEEHKLEIDQLKKELDETNNKLENYIERIKELEQEKIATADFFKLELIKKSKLAQEEVNKKIDEITQKLNQELKHSKKYAIEGQAIDLISIISQFESVISIEVDDPSVKNYLVGFKMFLNMFNNLLADMNISEIKIKIGDNFDEKTMEAVSINSEADIDSNCVTRVSKKGYKLHDKVIQFAKVEVRK